MSVRLGAVSVDGASAAVTNKASWRGAPTVRAPDERKRSRLRPKDADKETRMSSCAPSSFSRRTAVRLWVLVAVLPSVISIASVAAQPVPLALNGYDPVAYFTGGKPMRGLPDIAYEWNGYRYRFSSAGHRDLFKADPKRYAPQFENYCAMALSKGELVVADPENWLISNGKLYVFGRPAPAGPALFQTDLVENIAKANQNRSLIPKH